MKVSKLILWISALVLIAALGVSVIYIKVSRSKTSAFVTGMNVVNSTKFTDGLPDVDFFKHEEKIEREGKYNITFEPTLVPGHFVIGNEVYDSDGKMIGASVLFDKEALKTAYKFKEGTCAFHFRYITSEQDLRDYVDEYDASLGGMTLDEVVKKVNFSGFKENGRVTVRIKGSFSYSTGDEAGFIALAVLTAISVSLIAVLIVLAALYKQTKPAEPEVYDGTAPEVPAVPPKRPAEPVMYAYQPVQQYSVPARWSCSCGENSNTGRFCVNCGRPIPMQQMPVTYQMPVQPVQPVYVQYQAPVQQYRIPVQQYQVPVQQYQAPVTYQMPVQPAYVPVSYVRAPMPVSKAKPGKPEPAPADPEFVDGMKSRISSIGAKYAAFCVEFILVQLGVALLLLLLVPDVVKQYKTSINLGLVVLAVDIIGFPLVWLLMRGIPKVKIEQHKLGFAEWFRFLMITEALLMAGSMMGNVIHTALTLPFTGNGLNGVNGLVDNSHVLVRSLVVGIGAPIFEELIFRKILIDRTIKYGEYVSIVISGVMFGLLHGNFSQFFFATFVGMLFAYIYIRTGRIRYTIFLHMAINLSSSLVLQSMLSVLMKARATGDYYSPVTIICLLITFAWTSGIMVLGILGTIRFIKGLKRKELALKMMKGEPCHKQVNNLLVKDRVFWLYIAMAIVLFLNTYLPNIITFFMNR